MFSPEQPQEKSSPSFRSIARALPRSGPGKLSQQYHMHVGSPWWYTALGRLFCPRSCSSNALWIRRGNIHAHQPGTFRTGNRQLDGCTALSIILSRTPLLVSEYSRVPIASLSSNETQIASAKNPRAPTPSADDSHGVVPAARTSASSVVPPSQFWFLSTARTRASSDVPFGHGLSSATETALHRRFPQALHKLSNGGMRAKRCPHQPWHGSLHFARSPPGTCGATRQLR